MPLPKRPKFLGASLSVGANPFWLVTRQTLQADRILYNYHRRRRISYSAFQERERHSGTWPTCARHRLATEASLIRWRKKRLLSICLRNFLHPFVVLFFFTERPFEETINLA